MKALLLLLLLGVVAACHEQQQQQQSVPTHVAAWEPVDEAFRGCDGACGARAQAEEPGVLVQTRTAAQIGDRVYCPVSGVVLTVSAETAFRDVDGHRWYFCCASCAAWFTANEARVRAARREG